MPYHALLAALDRNNRVIIGFPWASPIAIVDSRKNISGLMILLDISVEIQHGPTQFIEGYLEKIFTIRESLLPNGTSYSQLFSAVHLKLALALYQPSLEHSG